MMGSSCAPTYANLFLGWWEDTVVFRDDEIIWTLCILYWGHFIDDIFTLCKGSKQAFREFVESLNTNYIGLRFTYEINDSTVSFLDIWIE